MLKTRIVFWYILRAICILFASVLIQVPMRSVERVSGCRMCLFDITIFHWDRFFVNTLFWFVVILGLQQVVQRYPMRYPPPKVILGMALSACFVLWICFHFRLLTLQPIADLYVLLIDFYTNL